MLACACVQHGRGHAFQSSTQQQQTLHPSGPQPSQSLSLLICTVYRICPTLPCLRGNHKVVETLFQSPPSIIHLSPYQCSVSQSVSHTLHAFLQKCNSQMSVQSNSQRYTSILSSPSYFRFFSSSCITCIFPSIFVCRFCFLPFPPRRRGLCWGKLGCFLRSAMGVLGGGGVWVCGYAIAEVRLIIFFGGGPTTTPSLSLRLSLFIRVCHVCYTYVDFLKVYSPAKV